MGIWVHHWIWLTDDLLEIIDGLSKPAGKPTTECIYIYIVYICIHSVYIHILYVYIYISYIII